MRCPSCAALLSLLLAGVLWARPAAPPPLNEKQRHLWKQRERLFRLGGEFIRAGKPGEAVPLARRGLDIERAILGEPSADGLAILTWLGSHFLEHERFAEAETAFAERLALLRRWHGQDSWQATDARLEWQHVQWLPRASRKQRQQLNQAHQDRQRVAEHMKAGQWAEALPLARKNLSVYREIVGLNHPFFNGSLNDLASVYRALGQLRLALPLYQQALRSCREIQGVKHPSYATALNNLASLYHALGEFHQALPLFRESVRLTRELLGEQDPHYPGTLSNLAMLYQDMGEHRLALPLHQEALERTRAVQGEKDPAYGAYLNNLGMLYLTMGEHRHALPLLRRALQHRQEVLGPRHPELATSLNNLGMLHHARQEFHQAIPLLQRAVRLRETILGKNHPASLQALHNLATVYLDMAELRQALPLLQQTAKRCQEVLGEKHPLTATSLNSLAVLYHSLGEYRKALPLLQQVRHVQREVLGEHHPDHAATLRNLAALHETLRQPGHALPLAGRSLALSREYLETVAAIQSERQQLDASRHLRYHLDWWLFLSAGHPDLVGIAHEQVLRFKGAALVRQQLRRLLDADHPDVRRTTGELHTVAQQLARLALRNPTPATQEARWRDLEWLSRRKEELEAKLSGLSEPFRRHRQLVRTSDVQRVLPADAALIDYHIYLGYLTAFVVRPTRVIRVELGALAPIEQTIQSWRQHLDSREGKRAALALRRMLWEPLVAHLERARLLLISPDGALASVPFAALPGGKVGTYLLEEHAIAVVPVPQQLPEMLAAGARKAPVALLAVGAVDFDTSESAVPAAGRHAQPGLGVKWPPLPGTRREAQVVHTTFTRHFRHGTVTYLDGAKANKTALQRTLGQHDHIHLATHAFFAPPHLKAALAEGPKRVDRITRFDLSGVSGWHPDLLAGIVLAGANRAGKDEDGILTALEVRELDLSRCQLVTLSACETGLGRVAGGEGVIGLQRAFQIAGARTTLTSLWSVSDAATSLLMEEFYRRLWGKSKHSTLEALRQAQLQVLNNPAQVQERARQLRAEWQRRGLGETVLEARGLGKKAVALPLGASKERSSITWWAGFVLAGDWR